MEISTLLTTKDTYHNPLYGREFPDPFVLKYAGEYWAYCTGFWHDDRCFGILHSRDLVHWTERAGAMEPLPGGATCYWAPEVTYANGRFYMYYSVGDEERMQIRVAVAEHPAGPFVDSGRRLTNEPFAIDPHLFQDESGARYLFYATDFLDRDYVGTGTVRDRLLDPFTLEGDPQPVTLACYDWQIYDPQRAEKGGVCWYTVEGPFVLERKGRYYQMFSGGNWRNPGYGVSYATTNDVREPQEWEQLCDGEQVLPILRTVPGEVIGPGHNSVVRGPDNRQLFCVYHRWSDERGGRLLALDRLDWAGERLLVLGPSHTPQPVPLPPTFFDFFDDAIAPEWQRRDGSWKAGNSALIGRSSTGEARLRYDVPLSAFLVEVNARALPSARARGAHGLNLYTKEDLLLSLRLEPMHRRVLLRWHGDRAWHEATLPLPADFDPAHYHLLRLDLDGRQATVTLDEKTVHYKCKLSHEVTAVALAVEQGAAAFAGFALTLGWEEIFVDPDCGARGWTSDRDAWELQDGELRYVGAGIGGAMWRESEIDDYEMVVNARLLTPLAPESQYGFYPVSKEGPLLTVAQDADGWALWWRDEAHRERVALPDTFDPTTFQHFRLHKVGDQLLVYWQDQWLAANSVASRATRIGLYAAGNGAAFDMVRVTAIP